MLQSPYIIDQHFFQHFSTRFFDGRPENIRLFNYARLSLLVLLIVAFLNAPL